MTARWIFPESNTMHRIGIGESGIETFRGSPISSLVREICQNSLDAVKDKSKPVRVEFEFFEILADEFPDENNLMNTFEQCKSYSETYMNNKDTSRFFDNAIKTIQSDVIPIIRISDYNTIGLTGSDKIHEVNPWTSLIYSDGISDKDISSGGSYGIGKNAIFVCSKFRTVFYSTLDIDNKKASQGVSKLISYKNENGKFSENIGYYGDNQKPVYDLLNLDKTYSRAESGTDIYVTAFETSENWETEIIASVIENYLLSIYNNKLNVKVNDVEINMSTLQYLVSKYSDRLNYAQDYYDTLTNPNTHTTMLNIDNIGAVTLKILFGKNFKRRVLMSRGNGMKIYDQDRISSSIFFAGVLIMNDEKVNEVFRAMENPQHNAWEPNRAGINANRYKRILQQLKRDIKQFVIEKGQGTISDEVDAEGIGEFLPNYSQQEQESDNYLQKESLNYKTKNITLRRLKIEKIDASSEGEGQDEENLSDLLGKYDEEGQFEGYEGGKGRRSGNKPPFGSYSPDDDGNANININSRHIPLKSIRIMVINPLEKLYRMLLTLEEPITKGFVEINLSGEQGSSKAKIENPTTKGLFKTIKRLKHRNNKIFLENVSENKKYEIEFKVNYPINCSLEARVYGN